MNHIFKILYRQADGEYRTRQLGTQTMSPTEAKAVIEAQHCVFVGYSFLCERKDAGCNCQHLQKSGNYWSKSNAA